MIPEGSIYFWMYEQGLKGRLWSDVFDECVREGRAVRPKDEQNFWNGWYKHSLYFQRDSIYQFEHVSHRKPFDDMAYGDYPPNPYGKFPEVENRWVPCNADGKPLFKWSNGCLSKADALAMRGCKTLAENLKGCHRIVIDCDGDHDAENIDYETVRFLSRYIPFTHALAKPKSVKDYGPVPFGAEDVAAMPASFHLTFYTDKAIPTMHFPKSHIDIIGNKANSLRYFKNKIWNNVEPAVMTDSIWLGIKEYILEREERK